MLKQNFSFSQLILKLCLRLYSLVGILMVKPDIQANTVV